MIEVVRQHQLPFVEDGNPNVVEELAEQLGPFIDGDIPGVGITHTAERNATHDGMHHWHRNLVMSAAAVLDPRVDITMDTGQKARRPLTFPPDLGSRGYYVHGDLEARLDPGSALILKLRLHTSGEDNGAEAILLNSAPGFFAHVGDTDLFGRWDCVYREAGFRGYDGQGRLYSHNALERVPEMSNGEGCVTVIHQQEIYRYTESPRSSILFRTQSSMGSVSLHGFRSTDGSRVRQFHATDFYIESQTV